LTATDGRRRRSPLSLTLVARRARRVLLAALLAAPAGPAHALTADPNFHDGLWRVEVATEIRGYGMKPAPPYHYQGCYSKREFTERLTAPGGPCRAIPTEVREDEMTWRLLCSPKVGEVNGTIQMKFQGSRMEGTMVTRTAYPQPMEVTQRISGQRIGDCKQPPRRAPPGAGAQPRIPLKDYDEDAK
jgi:hypothetical protein